MKQNQPGNFGRILVLCVLAVAGCTKKDAAILVPEKIPAAMQVAFNKSSTETKAMAQDAATACQGSDTVAAFTDLQKLSEQSDLTPEQRSTTAHAMAALMGKLRAQSESGDQAAQATLHQYMSSR